MFIKAIFYLKRGLITIEKIAGASSLLLLLLITLFQIIARNFFDTGFAELEVISRHLVLFVTFMGAALVSEQGKHIKIDILSAFLSTELKEKTVRPLLLLSSALCAFFAKYSIDFWLDEWNYAPDYEMWSVYMALILPVGFILLSLHLFLLSITGFEQKKI
jgi:TRAP-type transport system small permease protein